jgi:uncharacterized protein (TIGR00269 family)
MLCRRCGSEEAVIHRKYSGEYLCARCFSRSIRKKFRRTLREHWCLSNEDKLAVAISGGKESAALLYLIKDVLGKTAIPFFAYLVDEGIAGYRDRAIENAKDLCNGLEVPLVIGEFREHFGTTLDELLSEKGDLAPCTYCGVMRRWLLNRGAREAGATAIATGHNLDDEVQTFLLNFSRGDVSRLARIGVKYPLSHPKFLRRIKPLREIPERETLLFSIVNGISFFDGECPYARHATRNETRGYIDLMEEKHPSSKYNMLATFDKIHSVMLRESEKAELFTCISCDEPTSKERCKTCELLGR